MGRHRPKRTTLAGELPGPPPPDGRSAPPPSLQPLTALLARPRVELALLALLAVLPYLSSLSNGFVYDDVVLIVARAAPASLADALSAFTHSYHPSGLPYYRPLSALTLSIQKAISGDAPLPYHLFNLLLLAGAALASRALFLALPGLGGPRRGLAFVFALLLAWHPTVSSVVHAISGRETLLAFLLMTAACWAYLHAGRRWHVASLALLGAALLCKEQAVALPLLFVLADWLELTPDSPRRRAAPGWSAQATAWIDRYVLVVLIVLVYLAVRGRVLAGAPEGQARHLQLALLQAPGRPLLSIVYLLQTSFWPTADLRYEPHLPAWWSTGRALLTAVTAFGLAHLALRYGQPRRPLLLFFAGWALVTLLPSANLLAQETYYDERYMVTPLLGIIGFVLVLAGELWAQRRLQRWLGGAAVAALAVLGLLSQHRGGFFADDERFLTQWASADPTSYQARASLAELHRKRSDYERAVGYEREALTLIHAQLPEPQCIKRHFALGDALTRTGRHDEAVAQYEEILRLRPAYAGARRLLEQARARAAASPKRMALTAPGELTGDARERLLALLSAPELAGRPVWLAVTGADPRSLRLAADLEAIFKQARWQVRSSERVAFGVKPGLFMLAADDEAPGYAKQLQQALGDAGLPVGTFGTGYRAYSKEMIGRQAGWNGFRLAPDQDYVLVVGRLGG